MSPEFLTAIGTILSVIVVALFRDWRDGKSLFKKNGKHEGETPEWAKQLQLHYNEETTAELKKMNASLESIKDENIKHHQFEEGKFELLEALIKK